MIANEEKDSATRVVSSKNATTEQRILIFSFIEFPSSTQECTETAGVDGSERLYTIQLGKKFGVGIDYQKFLRSFVVI